MEKKTIWAYIDGKKSSDVVKAAQAAGQDLAAAMRQIVSEHPDNDVTFKVGEVRK